VRTTAAPASRAASASISGSGVASANTIGFLAIDRIIDGVTLRAADRPTNRSAPSRASATDPRLPSGFRSRAAASLKRFIPSARPSSTIPWRSHRVISGRPALRRKRATLMPAPPAPVMTARSCPISLPTTLRALRRAPRTVEQAPCMSLKKKGTGRSASFIPSRISRSSNERGEAMSSIAKAPKVGVRCWIIRAIRTGSRSLVQSGKASIPASVLNRIAFPSMTGCAAAGPASPYDSTEEPSVRIATALPRMV